jgi:hypothetical protein
LYGIVQNICVSRTDAIFRLLEKHFFVLKKERLLFWNHLYKILERFQSSALRMVVDAP